MKNLNTDYNIQKSESIGFFDLDRPQNQAYYYDIGPELQMDLPEFEDSVEIVTERMCDTQYRKPLQLLSKTIGIFTHVMYICNTVI